MTPMAGRGHAIKIKREAFSRVYAFVCNVHTETHTHNLVYIFKQHVSFCHTASLNNIYFFRRQANFDRGF